MKDKLLKEKFNLLLQDHAGARQELQNFSRLYDRQQSHVHNLQRKISRTVPLFLQFKQIVQHQEEALALGSQEVQHAKQTKEFCLEQLQQLTKLNTKQQQKKNSKSERRLSAYQQLQAKRGIQVQQSKPMGESKARSLKLLKNSAIVMSGQLKRELSKFESLKNKIIALQKDKQGRVQGVQRGPQECDLNAQRAGQGEEGTETDIEERARRLVNQHLLKLRVRGRQSLGPSTMSSRR